MTRFHKILGQGVAVALLLLRSATGVYGQVPGAGLGSFGGELRGSSLIEGKVVCVGCRVDEVQKARPDLADLYLLQHGQDQAVLEVTKVSDPQ